MEYIFIVIALLIFGGCIVSIFLEKEQLESIIIYEKDNFIKIIKYDEKGIAKTKTFKGKKANFIYKFFC